MVFASLAFAVTTLSAQNNRVTLSRQNLTIAEAFREIESQTNRIVAVNLGRFDVTKRVQIQTNPASLEEMLSQLLVGTGHTFQIAGNYIMIIPPKAEVKEMAVVARPHDYTTQEQRQRFENDVNDYTRRNLNNQPPQQNVQPQPQTTIEYETVMRYDTITHSGNRDGSFKYPSQNNRTPQFSGREVQTRSPFMFDTPPFVAIKTNLLYAATLTLNASIEIGLGKKMSLEVAGGNNPWKLKGTTTDNKKLVHWGIKPELRYWLCERFNGHYFGLHGVYAQYNIGGYKIPLLDFEKEYRYEGNAIGAGISYGYHWMWNQRWGMEFNIGVGALALDYDKYNCEKCGDSLGNFKKTYFGPTSAGIKLIFIIK